VSDEPTPNQTRGKTKLSDAMAVIKELRAYDEFVLSSFQRQALPSKHGSF